MTLQELFNTIGEHKNFLLYYYLLVPISAHLAGVFGKGEGHLSPWKFFYSFLVYAVSVPCVMAVGLNLYFFLFQRRDIMQADVFSANFAHLLDAFYRLAYPQECRTKFDSWLW